MAAVYGILGDCDSAELEALGDRLAHRGSGPADHWRCGGMLHLGQRSMLGRGGAGGLPMVLDGVIENLDEVATRLDPANRTPSPDDAAAVVVGLFRRFGLEALCHLKGPYALALWDEANERLVLARDFLGSRSLFYTVAGGRFLFASEYKALLAIPEVSAAPNLQALQAINRTRSATLHASCLAEVFPVPAGHWVSACGRRVEQGRYWGPDIDIAQRSDTEHVRAYRDSFLAVIRRQIEPYERIGVAISGGVDGASVVAGIRRVAPARELHTFCAGFGRDDPELAGAVEVASHFDTTHHEIVVSAAELGSLLAPMTWHLEDPVGREDVPCLFVCAREAAAHGVQVLLGGHVADAMTGGMPRHLLVALANRFPLIGGPLEELVRYTRTGQQPRTLLGRLALSGYFRGGTFPPPRILGAGEQPSSEGIRVSGPEPLTRYLRKALLSDPGRGHYDRIQAAFGVGYNAPFSDPEFASMIFRIPDHMKIRGRTQKYVLRQALKDLSPPSFAERRKSLSRLRNDRELGEMMDHLADNLLAPAAVRERGVFEPAYVEQVRHRPAGQPYREERLYRLWTMVLTELWFRIFVDRRGAFPAGGLG